MVSAAAAKLTPTRSIRIIMKVIWTLVKLIWAIAAQLLTVTAFVLLPIFVSAAVAVQIVKPDLVPGIILVGLFAWSALLVKFLGGKSRTAAAVKRAHRRFVFPFGEV